MEYKQLKEDACRYVDELKPLIYEIADKLHARPELGQEEFFCFVFTERHLDRPRFYHRQSRCRCFSDGLSWNPWKGLQ